MFYLFMNTAGDSSNCAVFWIYLSHQWSSFVISPPPEFSLIWDLACVHQRVLPSYPLFEFPGLEIRGGKTVTNSTDGRFPVGICLEVVGPRGRTLVLPHRNKHHC